MLLGLLLISAMLFSFLAGIIWSVGIITQFLKIGFAVFIIWVALKVLLD